MEAGVQAAVRQVGRLRREIGWPFVLAEGIVALVVGLAIMMQPETARTTLRQLLGAALLLTSFLSAFAAFRGYREGARDDLAIPLRLFGGGVGVTVGLLVVLEPFSESIPDTTARVLLAAGLLAYGLIDLGAYVAARVAGSRRPGALLTGVLYSMLGVLLYFYVQTSVVSIYWFGILAIVGGLLLIGYAFLLRSAVRAASASARAST
jgi:uncharacterized membrane protein HdeD (DUF308 family)